MVTKIAGQFFENGIKARLSLDQKKCKPKMNGLPTAQDVKEVTFRKRIKSRVKSRCAPKENARIPSDKDFTRVSKKICAEVPMHAPLSHLQFGLFLRSAPPVPMNCGREV